MSNQEPNTVETARHHVKELSADFSLHEIKSRFDDQGLPCNTSLKKNIKDLEDAKGSMFKAMKQCSKDANSSSTAEGERERMEDATDRIVTDLFCAL